MADSSAPSWIQLLVSSGVLGLVGAGATRVWKWTVERPLRRAEARAQRAEDGEEYWHRRYDEVTAELKATTIALRSIRRIQEHDDGAPLSMPPPRDEMPTLEHIIESRADRAWAEQRERERALALNPRQAEIDEELRRGISDLSSTPPRGFTPPEGLRPLSKPFPPRRGR